MADMARSGARTETASFISRLAVANLPVRAPREWNALALCEFVREVIRYQTEDPETFVSLDALLWLGAGDCDDMAIALAALLMRAGWPVRFAVGMRDGAAVHVWVRTREQSDGSTWFDLDPSTFRVDAGTSPASLGEFDDVREFDVPRGE